ncbi:hypothetical protein F2981_07055 [Sinorhizobium meliloti]|nr:hypothetical protein [Sinorhizobium meliloti]
MLITEPGYQLFQAANNTAVMVEVPPDRARRRLRYAQSSRQILGSSPAHRYGVVFRLRIGCTRDRGRITRGRCRRHAITFTVAGVLVMAALVIAAPEPAS